MVRHWFLISRAKVRFLLFQILVFYVVEKNIKLYFIAIIDLINFMYKMLKLEFLMEIKNRLLMQTSIFFLEIRLFNNLLTFFFTNYPNLWKKLFYMKLVLKIMNSKFYFSFLFLICLLVYFFYFNYSFDLFTEYLLTVIFFFILICY